MKEEQSTRDRDTLRNRIQTLIGRRTFISTGGATTATLLAGCTSGGQSTNGQDDGSGAGSESTDSMDSGDDSDSTDGETTYGGNFRLLISDLPADIGDFDSLDVWFRSARVFDGGEERSSDEPADTEDTVDQESPDGENDDEDESTESNNEESDNDNGDGNPNNGVERRRGFYILDLDDATVDLTQVVGDKAKPVFEGTLSEGSYNKIELHVSAVEGIVDGEQVEVKVPSEKLQVTHPFEIRADETVDFVFDINVVRRGRDDRYNLTPVISGSGVNGEDVDVETMENGGGDVEESENGIEESDPGNDGANGDGPDDDEEDEAEDNDDEDEDS